MTTPLTPEQEERVREIVREQRDADAQSLAAFVAEQVRKSLNDSYSRKLR